MARERRTLIAEIGLIPCPDGPPAPLSIEVRGDRAAMLALGSGSTSDATEALASRIKLIAGARNQLELLTCATCSSSA